MAVVSSIIDSLKQLEISLSMYERDDWRKELKSQLAKLVPANNPKLTGQILLTAVKQSACSIDAFNVSFYKAIAEDLLEQNNIDLLVADSQGDCILTWLLEDELSELLKLYLAKIPCNIVEKMLTHGLAGTNSNALYYANTRGSTTCLEIMLSYIVETSRIKTFYFLFSRQLLLAIEIALKANWLLQPYKNIYLLRAVQINDLALLELLLDNGAEIDFLSPYQNEAPGYTALTLAVRSGYKESLETLLKRGAAIEKGFGRTPLIIAAQYGADECVKLLLQYGALVNARDNDGYTALLRAVAVSSDWANGLECVNLLLQYGADITVTVGMERNALMIAAGCGHSEIVELLLAHKIDINAVDTLGNSALMHAAERGQAQCAKLLLQHGADSNQLSHYRRETALSKFINGNRHDCQEVIKLLIAKCDLAQLLANRAPQIHILLASRGDSAQLLELLKCDASVAQHSDMDGQTALIVAAARGHTACIEILINKGANIDGADIAGETALHYAVCNNKLPAVRLLLNNGANINVQDNEGRTPLMRGAACGHVGVLTLLLQNQANIYLKDRVGYDALDWARPYPECRQLLINYLPVRPWLLPYYNAAVRFKQNVAAAMVTIGINFN